MTKLKNTKKGMAKKALSISLVAAMLATSNVPVWAAEDLFSDGSAAVEAPAAEVETFGSEPAEEVANDVSTYAATANASFTLKSWGAEPVLSGELVDADGNAVQYFNYEWLIDGRQPVDENGNAIPSNQYSGMSNTGYSSSNFADFLKYKPLATDTGKTLTLHIVGTGEDAGFEYTTPGVTIAAKNVNEVVSDDQIKLGTYFQQQGGNQYTGKPLTVTAEDIWVDSATGLTSNDFIYTYEGDTTNATVAGKVEGYIIATVNKTGYTGQKNILFNITKAKADADSFEATLKTKEFMYTGNEIEVTGDDVTLKNNYTGGNVNSDALRVVAVDDSFAKANFKNVGDKAYLRVTEIDSSKDSSLANNVDTTGEMRYTTEEKATVVARQLTSDMVQIVSGKYSSGATYNQEHILNNYVKFVDEDGNELNLKNDVTATLDRAVTGEGEYTLTITGNGENVTGTVTTTLSLRANSLKDAKFENNEKASEAEYYTGEEITKSDKLLGNLKVGDVVLKKDKQYTVTYSKNTDVGKATMTIKGIGDWSGEKTYTFEIKPAKIEKDTITVPKTVEFDGSNVTASDYLTKEDITVEATTQVRDADGKLVEKTIAVPADSFDVEFSIGGNTDKKPVLNDEITTKVIILDKNYGGKTDKSVTETAKDTTKISNKSIEDDSVTIEVVDGPYTFTGEAINPTLKVMYGDQELLLDRDYEISAQSNNVNAGDNATVTIVGIGDYSGTKTVTFTINPAKTADIVVTQKEEDETTSSTYTGQPVQPGLSDFTVMLGDVDVSQYFDVTYPTSVHENIDAGKDAGTMTLVPKKNTENFEGTKEVKFEIFRAVLDNNVLTGAALTAWTEDGKVATLGTTTTDTNVTTFDYTGDAYTFDKVEFKTTNSKLKEGVDYEIVYFNNTTGPDAAVYVNAIGNYKNPETNKFEGSETTYSFAKYFKIDGVSIRKVDVTVEDSAYAGGLPVKPNVTIKIGEKALIEGTDYEIETTGDTVNVTPANTVLGGKIVAKGGYTLDEGYNGEFTWKIVAKDLKDTDVTATKADGVLNVTVMNGSVQVPASEYDVTENEDGTVTVTAKAGSTNYTGSQTVTLEDQDTAIGTPIISEVKVNGNKIEVVLAGECDGATGYDYVISTANDYQNGRLPNGINKNQLTTSTTYQYIDQGMYYAYCHAWKRVNGVKVFSDWSNIMPFSVSAITPEKPTITSVKKSGRSVTVTWTQCDDAQGYDVVLGTAVRKVNGELRPVEYGKAVKKVGKNTYSVTFKSCPKGATFYAGLHAWNRTSETGVKVFSPWSDSVKVTI